MSSTMNGKVCHEGPLNYAAMPAAIRHTRETASKPLTPADVRRLMAGCYPAKGRVKPQQHRVRNAMAPYKFTADKIEKAERMVYVEGKTFREAAEMAGCSVSRVYGVLSQRRLARRKEQAAQRRAAKQEGGAA